jgi:hypothetical protein
MVYSIVNERKSCLSCFLLVYDDNIVDSFHSTIDEVYCWICFSMTISILPSFYMKTFDFADSLCFYSYPSTLGIDILPYVFVTYIGLVMYFIVYFILHQFFDKHRFCCANECASYAAFGCLILLLIGFVLFSATIIFYVWIVSFIEKNLRLPAILLVVQVPFLFIQILIDWYIRRYYNNKRKISKTLTTC